MREIKFRIWDNKLNIFSTPENNDAREFFIHFGGYRMIRCHDGYSQPTIVWDEEIKNRYSIQQYTGLKDKNGIEIYEGDIVKATSDQYENENFVGKVIFDEGCFLTWVNKNDIRGIWGEDDIEVIGNIFENSDLLKA